MRVPFRRNKKTASQDHSLTRTIKQESASPASDKILASDEPPPLSDWTLTPSTPRHNKFQGSLNVTPTTPLGQLTPSSSSRGVCQKCSSEGVSQITKSSSRSGNAGRPFLRCSQHGFIRWLDERGIHVDNPLCDCDRSSRRSVAGPEKGRKVFFSCAAGECRFWQADQRVDGRDWCVDDNTIEILLRLGLI